MASSIFVTDICAPSGTRGSGGGQGPVIYDLAEAADMGLATNLLELIADAPQVLKLINATPAEEGRTLVYDNQEHRVRVLMQKAAIGDCLNELETRKAAKRFVKAGGLEIIDRCLLQSADTDYDQLYLVLRGLERILEVGRWLARGPGP